jgi:hypothetical protein
MFDHGRSLVKQNEGKPFAMVGVNLDRTAVEGLDCQLENDLNWRSFFDGNNMSISDGYGVSSIPTVIVIDHKGKIQWIGNELHDRLIDKLIAEVD